MKKRVFKFITYAAIIAMTLSVTACGGSNVESAEITEVADVKPEKEAESEAAKSDNSGVVKDDKSETVKDDKPETDSVEENIDTVAATGDTVESLLNDPATKAQYAESFAAYEDEGFSVSVEAKENDLIMSLTILDASVISNETAEQLQLALDSDENASTFSALAAKLDQAIGAENGTCTYSVRYLDPDGKLLAEKTYTAE